MIHVPNDTNFKVKAYASAAFKKYHVNAVESVVDDLIESVYTALTV